MIVTFAGHSSISEQECLLRQTINTIRENLPTNEPVLFYCGGYGAFDALCARACQSIKREYPYCRVCYITPYLTNKLKHMDPCLYDEIIYPPLENVPPRLAILKRNQWMIDESDLVISYVKYQGGAFQTLEYAKKKKKRIINLAQRG